MNCDSHAATSRGQWRLVTAFYTSIVALVGLAATAYLDSASAAPSTSPTPMSSTPHLLGGSKYYVAVALTGVDPPYVQNVLAIVNPVGSGKIIEFDSVVMGAGTDRALTQDWCPSYVVTRVAASVVSGGVDYTGYVVRERSTDTAPAVQVLVDAAVSAGSAFAAIVPGPSRRGAETISSGPLELSAPDLLPGEALLLQAGGYQSKDIRNFANAVFHQSDL